MAAKYIQTKTGGVKRKDQVFRRTNKEFCISKYNLLLEITSLGGQRRESRGRRNPISSSKKKYWLLVREYIRKLT